MVQNIRTMVMALLLLSSAMVAGISGTALAQEDTTETREWTTTNETSDTLDAESVTLNYDRANDSYSVDYNFNNSATDIDAVGMAIFNQTADHKTSQPITFTDNIQSVNSSSGTMNLSNVDTSGDYKLSFEVTDSVNGTRDYYVYEFNNPSDTTNHTHTLEVSTVDSDGNSIEANVTVDNTSKTGNTTVFELEDGEYGIEASADGYSTAGETVTINGSNETIEITMTEEKDDEVYVNDEDDVNGDNFKSYGTAVIGIIVSAPVISVVVLGGLYLALRD